MTLTEYYQEYGIWALLFTIIAATICYYAIKIIEWALFIIRTKKRIRHLNVDCFISRDNSNYPCKLCVDFRNWTNTTILIKLEGFKISKEIKPSKKAKRDSTSGLLETKFIELPAQQSSEQEILNVDSIIRHGENKMVWIPLDPNQTDDFLQKALKEGKIGKFKVEILLFNESPQLIRFRPKIKRN